MIEVNFPTGVNEVTAAPGLYEWDYGQILKITGLGALQTVQIHFSDKSCQKAIVRLGNLVTDGIEVAIPDLLLENAYSINAFIYVESYKEAPWVTATTTGTYYTLSGSTYTAVTLPDDYVAGTTYYQPSAQTIKRISIPVIPRKKPEDFIDPIPPSEQTQLDEMIAAVNGSLEAINDLYESTITTDDLNNMIEGVYEIRLQRIEENINILDSDIESEHQYVINYYRALNDARKNLGSTETTLYDSSLTEQNKLATNVTKSTVGLSGKITLILRAYVDLGGDNVATIEMDDTKEFTLLWTGTTEAGQASIFFNCYDILSGFNCKTQLIFNISLNSNKELEITGTPYIFVFAKSDEHMDAPELKTIKISDGVLYC